MKHPMQPIHLTPEGIARFEPNPIVLYLLNDSVIDMNHLARVNFSDEDREHFAQLIGYSVAGFAELDYASDEVVHIANKIAERLCADG